MRAHVSSDPLWARGLLRFLKYLDLQKQPEEKQWPSSFIMTGPAPHPALGLLQPQVLEMFLATVACPDAAMTSWTGSWENTEDVALNYFEQ